MAHVIANISHGTRRSPAPVCALLLATFLIFALVAPQAPAYAAPVASAPVPAAPQGGYAPQPQMQQAPVQTPPETDVYDEDIPF